MPYQSVSRTIDDSMGSFIKMHQYLAKSCLTNKKNEATGCQKETISENEAQESIPQKFEAFIIPLGVSGEA